MSLIHPSLKLSTLVANWAERCVNSNDPKFLEYLVTAENHREKDVPYAGKEKRNVISLNYLAAQIAVPELPPDAIA